MEGRGYWEQGVEGEGRDELTTARPLCGGLPNTLASPFYDTPIEKTVFFYVI